MVRLFRRRKQKADDGRKTLDAIEQIEAEVEKLEKQWEDKEREFALMDVDIRHYAKDEIGVVSEDYSWRMRAPNKHLKKLWKGFVILSKKILAAEHYIPLLRKMEESAVTRHEHRTLKRLRKLIRLREQDAIHQLVWEIRRFESAIEDGKKAEREYMEEIYFEKSGYGKEFEEYWSEARRKTRRKLLDDIFKEHYGYSYDRRMKFFDHLEGECENLKKRLRGLV